MNRKARAKRIRALEVELQSTSAANKLLRHRVEELEKLLVRYDEALETERGLVRQERLAPLLDALVRAVWRSNPNNILVPFDPAGNEEADEAVLVVLRWWKHNRTVLGPFPPEYQDVSQPEVPANGPRQPAGLLGFLTALGGDDVDPAEFLTSLTSSTPPLRLGEDDADPDLWLISNEPRPKEP